MSATSARTVVVFAGGEALPPSAAAHIPQGAFVIAADSGLGQARALGCVVDVAVGDFDSAEPAHVAEAVASGVAIERHPTDKEATDLDLALERALLEVPESIIVAGGGGGRLDHLLANVLLLASPRFAAVNVRAVTGEGGLWVVRRSVTVIGEPGDYVTLLAVNGAAQGVHTRGLRYELSDDTLEGNSSRGVSNEFIGRQASIRVETGVLAVVVPFLRPPASQGDRRAWT